MARAQSSWQAVGMLIALIVAASTPGTARAALCTFPFCACQAPTPSPYQLRQSSSMPSADAAYTRVCYEISATGLSGATPCSQPFDLRKVELAVASACRRAVFNLTLNNEPLATSWGGPSSAQCSSDAAATAAFKITHGKPGSLLATYADIAAKPLQVCMSLAASVCSLEQLCSQGACKPAFFSPNLKCCPSSGAAPPPPAVTISRPPPPSPPPPAIKPPCNCSVNVPSPYRFTFPYTLPITGESDEWEEACWTVDTTDLSSPDANFDLRKIEFLLGDAAACRKSVRAIKFYDQSVAVSTYTPPSMPGTVWLKVTRGNRPLAPLSQLLGRTPQLCIERRVGDACKQGTDAFIFAPSLKQCPVTPL